MFALRYFLARRDERLERLAAFVAVVFKNWHPQYLLSVISKFQKNRKKDYCSPASRGKQSSSD